MPRTCDSLRLPTSSLFGTAVRASAAAVRLSFLTGELILLVALIVGAGFVLSGKYTDQPSAAPKAAADQSDQRLVESLAFSPDGKSLVSCGWGTSVFLWDVSRLGQGGAASLVALPHDSVQFAVAFSPDGSLLCAAGQDSAKIWTRRGDRWEPRVDRVGQTYRCMAFSPDGRTLALGCDDGSIRIWELPSGEERGVLEAHGGVVRSVSFGPDGRLVSSGQDRRVMLWDTKRCAPIRSLSRAGANPVQLVAFSPDGRSIAVGEVSGNPEEITLIDPETGDIRARLAGHHTGVNAIAFSPDGSTLATAGLDRSIKLWDVATEKNLTTITREVGWVKALAFSPDSRWLAFAGTDKNLRIWDLSQHRALRVGPGSSQASEEATPTREGPSFIKVAAPETQPV
jgi:WD40 repeat protein